MTVEDLKNILENMDPDKEIRIAFQPSWPLRARIQSVQDGEDLGDSETCAVCGADAEFRNQPTDGNPYAEAVCSEHIADGYDLLEGANTPDTEEYVWIAVDQVSSYGEHPYAPREAWS